MKYKIPLFWPYIPKSVNEELKKTFNTRWIGQGPKVELFEKAIGKKFKLKYPLMTNSGSAGLELAYELAGIKKGDEVITSILTCTATNIPLLRRGAKIVFADIDRKSMVMTNETVSNVMTKKTKAIIGTSLGGIKCNLTGFDVPVIIDACQATGHNNGDYIVYSFQAIKHFTTGDGGLLNVKNANQYKLAKKLRWFGIDREKKRASDWQAYKNRKMIFDIEHLGYKYQPTDIGATLGLCGLKEYDKILNHRKTIFNYYKKELSNHNGIQVVDGKDNVYWLAGLVVNNRDNFAKHLARAGIETNLVHLRNDIYKIFGGVRRSLPNMNWLEDKYIYLPIHMNITLKDAKYIVKCIKDIK